MKKTLLIIASLFALTIGSAFASTTYTFEINDNLSEKEEALIISYIGNDAFTMLKDMNMSGHKLKLTIIASDKGLRDPDMCEVEIEESWGGKGEISGGNKLVNGKVGGEGNSHKKVKVKGPCNKIGKVVKEVKEALGWK